MRHHVNVHVFFRQALELAEFALVLLAVPPFVLPFGHSREEFLATTGHRTSAIDFLFVLLLNVVLEALLSREPPVADVARVNLSFLDRSLVQRLVFMEGAVGRETFGTEAADEGIFVRLKMEFFVGIFDPVVVALKVPLTFMCL
jgi:hypothetical protein